jgi:myo-inositol-1(or 4)-monophosphatase
VNFTTHVEAFSPDLPETEDRYLKLAKAAALQAGKLQMESFGKSIKIQTKNTAIDLVTRVDTECDALITQMLRQACPNDIIVSEEQFKEGQTFSLENTWVVDPLDGTTNYSHGFPMFAVSIAYFWKGVPHLGVVYDPLRQEMFYSIRKRGAFLNDTPIFVSGNRVHSLSHALLATGFPYDIATCPNNNMDHFQRIAPLCQGVRRPGSAALDMAYVACGRIDGFWELKLSLWDIAAGIPMVEEAGGTVTALDGGVLSYTDRKIHLVASNGNGVHTELLAQLSS